MHAPVISYMPHQRIKELFVKHNCALHNVQPSQRRLAHLSGLYAGRGVRMCCQGTWEHSLRRL